MQLADFDFNLPEERIALVPVSPRDHARLLHVPAEAAFGHHHIYDLPDLLQEGDLLVANDSKVIPARLLGKRGAARVKVLLLRALNDGTWEALAKPAKRLKTGDTISFGEDFFAQVQSAHEEGVVHLRFSQSGEEFQNYLQRYGQVPLPPYIRRPPREEDKENYQTIYAREEGSVAAPTAGLHFTPELLQKLKNKGIGFATLTLHVGAGTFLPVKTENLEQHVMHAEFGEISATLAEAINQARTKGGRIIAVGTTACRLLETAADENGDLKEWRGETRLFIRPGTHFKIVDALLTNFHLPRSTLFMLVCAFAGTERMKAAYAEAISKNYRFYSYGDACFLEK